jgi:hypothetical protein
MMCLMQLSDARLSPDEGGAPPCRSQFQHFPLLHFPSPNQHLRGFAGFVLRVCDRCANPSHSPSSLFLIFMLFPDSGMSARPTISPPRPPLLSPSRLCDVAAASGLPHRNSTGSNSSQTSSGFESMKASEDSVLHHVNCP